jgi:quercetin dioxygenase-like cupin family protein
LRTYDSLSSLQPYQLWSGATARAVHGEQLTLAIIDLDPDEEVPEHCEDSEQVSCVLQGEVTMVVAGQAQNLRSGDTCVIPSNVVHGGQAGPNGATIVYAFSPPRTDWELLPRLEPSPRRWP